MQPTARIIAACGLLAVLAPALNLAAGVAGSRAAEEEATAVGRGQPSRPAGSAGGTSSRTGPTPAGKPVVPIAWRQHLQAARSEAAQRGVCVLIYFRADWCQPGRLMEQGAFLMPAIAQFINRHFIPVKVDDSDGRSDVTKTYEIRVYPSILFLDPAGKPLHLVLGPREPERFYRVMQQVKELPVLMDRQHAHPDSLEANFALGNALAKLNHLRRAAPYLEKAAALDPDNADGRLSQARLILAVVPLEDGQSKEALANLDAWLREFADAPEAPVAVWYQGTILYRDGRLAEAKRYFRQILDRFPKHAKAYEAEKAIEHIDARLRAKARIGEAGGKPKPPAKVAEDRPEPKG